MFKMNWGNHDLKISTDQVVCKLRSKTEYDEENEAFRSDLHGSIFVSPHKECLYFVG
jgi:hypothetical protein